MTKKDNFDLFVDIAIRAERRNLLVSDRISLIMDLECAHKEFNLRLTDLLAADDFNFAHDIVGIQNNLDRLTRKMDNLFVPRYAGFN